MGTENTVEDATATVVCAMPTWRHLSIVHLVSDELVKSILLASVHPPHSVV